MLNWPEGTYGIAYDLYTRNIEDILPTGWGSRRSSVYRRLGKVLLRLGYRREQ